MIPPPFQRCGWVTTPPWRLTSASRDVFPLQTRIERVTAARAARRLTLWWFTLVTSQFLRVLWALSAWAGGPAGRGNFTAFGTDEPLDFLSKFVFDAPE